MTDLVTRLRALADEAPSTWVGGLCREAADALTLLSDTLSGAIKRARAAEAEAAALRNVLTRYADDNYFGVNYVYATEAREALSQPGPGAALLARVRKLEAVAAAARIDLNTIATMPWNRDDHGHPQWTGLRDPLWSEWIHGTHAALEEALAAMEEKP